MNTLLLEIRQCGERSDVQFRALRGDIADIRILLDRQTDLTVRQS